MSSTIKWNFRFITFLQVFCKLTKFFNFNHLTLTMFFVETFISLLLHPSCFIQKAHGHNRISKEFHFFSFYIHFFYNEIKSLQFLYSPLNVKLRAFPPSSSKRHFFSRCQSSSSTSLHFQLAWKFYNNFCMENFITVLS